MVAVSLKKKIFFKQKTAYEIAQCLVGSEMCIRDSCHHRPGARKARGFTKKKASEYQRPRLIGGAKAIV